MNAQAASPIRVLSTQKYVAQRNSASKSESNSDHQEAETRLVQITEEEEANTLSIDFHDVAAHRMIKGVSSPTSKIAHMKQPLGSAENPIEIIEDGERLLFTQNIGEDHFREITRALQLEASKKAKKIQGKKIDDVIYRVVFPDELNLVRSQTKRGRPRKRLNETAQTETQTETNKIDDVDVDDDIDDEEERQILKSIRTRSGRIKRLPERIRKDIGKEPDENDLGNDPNLQDLNSLKGVDYVKPKRPMRSQYRCPGCHKAYLGYGKLLEHIQQNPSHGPKPSINKENDTWNFLIDLANKSKIRQRGIKFCKQLIALINNVKVIAKVLFKRATTSQNNLFFVDELMSKVLEINSGNYVINERHLQKDIDVLEFIVNNAPEHSMAKPVKDVPPPNKQDQTTIENCVNTLNFEMIQNCNLESEVAPSKCQNTNFQEIQFEPQHKRRNNPINIISIHTVTKPTAEYPLHNDLLNSLPTLRTSVEDLMMAENTQVSSLLDNSASSDEVMNVDQFVNERLKKFTEPDIELHNPALNLDLPSLDLFEYSSN